MGKWLRYRIWLLHQTGEEESKSHDDDDGDHESEDG